MAYQISVFLENKPGHLEKVTGVLKDAGVNIRAMTLSTSSAGWGILNLLVDRPEPGRDALKASGVPAVLREIVAARMPDQPGGLHDSLAHLARAGVNVQNAYATLLPGGKQAMLVIDVENIDSAQKLLAQAGVAVLSNDEIYGI